MLFRIVLCISILAVLVSTSGNYTRFCKIKALQKGCGNTCDRMCDEFRSCCLTNCAAENNGKPNSYKSLKCALTPDKYHIDDRKMDCICINPKVVVEPKLYCPCKNEVKEPVEILVPTRLRTTGNFTNHCTFVALEKRKHGANNNGLICDAFRTCCSMECNRYKQHGFDHAYMPLRCAMKADRTDIDYNFADCQCTTIVNVPKMVCQCSNTGMVSIVVPIILFCLAVATHWF